MLSNVRASTNAPLRGMSSNPASANALRTALPYAPRAARSRPGTPRAFSGDSLVIAVKSIDCYTREAVPAEVAQRLLHRVVLALAPISCRQARSTAAIACRAVSAAVSP